MTLNQLNAMMAAGQNSTGRPLTSVAKTRALIRMENLGRKKNYSGLSESAYKVREAERAAEAVRAAAAGPAAGAASKEGGRRRKTSKRKQRKRTTRRRR